MKYANVYVLKRNGDVRRGHTHPTVEICEEMFRRYRAEHSYATRLCILPADQCENLTAISSEVEAPLYEKYMREMEAEANGQSTRSRDTSDAAGDGHELLEQSDTSAASCPRQHSLL
jgi:hypothetical protein